jgi:hypothetical protein
MANKYRPHIYILPEDDANRQVALATLLGLDIDPQSYKVLHVAGGWLDAKNTFLNDHVPTMRQYGLRSFVLLVDGDMDADRFEQMRCEIPADLRDRVFILGSLDEPEDLKPDFGSLDEIGSRLAEDLSDPTLGIWNHSLLAVNVPEVRRMQATLCPGILSVAPE